MRNAQPVPRGDSARDWANWTQASLFTVGSSLRSAGSTLVTGLKAGYEHITTDHSEKETILGVHFGYLEFLRGEDQERRPVLVLIYPLGFQLWSVEDKTIKEIASRREETVRCLECVPLPLKSDWGKCDLLQQWPLLAVVLDVRYNPVNSVALDDDMWISCQLKLYSLQRHSYVHTINVPGSVLEVACSPRVLLVAMSAQIMAYDLCTFEIKFSTVTYPAPARFPGGLESPQNMVLPLALGPRWLACASNQAVQSANGVAISHSLANGSGSSPHNTHLETVQHYAGQAAKHGGRHLKTLGEASYKYLAGQVESWRNSSHPASPSSVSSGSREDSDIVGTVVVLDVVSRSTVTHFRAHTSPIALLQFDPSGTLLVTASVHGHTINIFHISVALGKGDVVGSATHLYKLSRGVTPALIQTVAFSEDGIWLCASSARGTTHIFNLGSKDTVGADMPPHLAAMNYTSSERASLRAAKLTALGRARSASLMSAAIPGSTVANAAVGLYSGSSGNYLVASMFAAKPESPASDGSLGIEDVWVASNDGQLFRHRLSLQEPPPQADSNPPSPPAKPETRPKSGGSQARQLAVEPVERFDICRRHTWPEREEQLFDSSGSSSPSASAHLSSQVSWAAQAETAVAGHEDIPLWADPQFHILEMQTNDNRNDAVDCREGHKVQALNVEEVPTRRVDLQDREGMLAPVIIEGAETAVLRGLQLKMSQDGRS